MLYKFFWTRTKNCVIENRVKRGITVHTYFTYFRRSSMIKTGGLGPLILVVHFVPLVIDHNPGYKS